MFNKELFIKYFEQKDYKPSWNPSLGISTLKTLSDRLEAYLITEYQKFLKSG